MSNTGNVFYSFYSYALTGKVSLLTDTIKCALLKSTYTPNLATQKLWSDVSGFEVSGPGYSSGGVTLGNPQVTELQSSGFSQVWQPNSLYQTGSVIIEDPVNNGFLFRAVYTGYSGSSEPDFTSVIGASTTDGATVWECIGSSVTYFTSNPAIWNSATFNTAYAVVYDATASGLPLIALVDFGQTFVVNAGSWSVSPQSNLGWFAVVPT